MSEVQFKAGEVIFYEGDEGNCFYEIIEGKVGIYVNYDKEDQRMLTVLGPGKYFGELAVIEATPRSTTVIAVSDVTLDEVPAEKMFEFFADDPDKILEIMNHIGDRIRALSEEYVEATEFYNEFISISSEKKSEGFMAKLKKYIDVYMSGKGSKKASIEAVRGETGSVGNNSLAVEKYRKGTVIFKKGELGNCMYAVQNGVVGIYTNYDSSDEIKLTEIKANGFFGEMGMIAQEERSATAIAEEDNTTVEIIRPEDLNTLFKENPSEVDMILRHLSSRLRKLTEDYMETCKRIYDAYNI